MSSGLAQSVQTRLLRHAKSLDLDPNLVLVRYATERLLYRLSRSRHAERFVLKGALLLLAWLGETIRPTRDVDLLGFGELDPESLSLTFKELCDLEIEPDGLVFDGSSIVVDAIRPEDAYGGQRLSMVARLGPARIRLQIDIGIGDAVVPEPEWMEYPSLLDLPRPRIKSYRPETAIAEKVHAMVVLGSKNSRMKDFFDIHALCVHSRFDGETLAMSLAATFERRGTALPDEIPIALSPTFADIDGKRSQWAGFLRRNRLRESPTDFSEVIAAVARFVGPVLAAAARKEEFATTWRAGGPWESKLAEG